MTEEEWKTLIRILKELEDEGLPITKLDKLKESVENIKAIVTPEDDDEPS
jgi:hypothetical protein